MNLSNVKKYLPVAGIVTMGLISALLIHLYLRTTAQNLERKYANDLDSSQVKAVVANRSLLPGAVITSENMSIRVMPRKYVHSNALTPEQMGNVFGRKLATTLEEGKPLLAEFLERPAPAPFSSRLVAGTRAITMAVDEINSISGLLRAGDHIDLLFSLRSGQGTKVEIFPLMQDVIVRATGQMMMEEVMARRSLTAIAQDEDKKSSYSTITVEVNQRDAERLVLAQTQGHLTAVLRGTDDHALLEDAHIGMADLLGIKRSTALYPNDDVVFLVGGQTGIQRSVFRPIHYTAAPR